MFEIIDSIPDSAEIKVIGVGGGGGGVGGSSPGHSQSESSSNISPVSVLTSVMIHITPISNTSAFVRTQPRPREMSSALT